MSGELIYRWIASIAVLGLGLAVYVWGGLVAVDMWKGGGFGFAMFVALVLLAGTVVLVPLHFSLFKSINEF